MSKIVKSSEAIIRKVAENKTAFNFITKEFSPNVSLAVIEGVNYDGEVHAEQNWIYYILEGEIRIEFNNQQLNLKKGDVYYANKGEHFRMIGTFKVINVSQPAFGTK